MDLPYALAFAPPLVSFEPCSQDVLNACLVAWDHKMGPLQRGNQGAVCHALYYRGGQ